jgi:hypothetical protein
VEAMGSVSRATGPSQPPAVTRRADAALLSLASRTSGAEPTLQRRSVEPVFRRPSLEPAAPRPTSEPVPGPAARPAASKEAGQAAVKAPAAPPFEWLDLEIIPLGQKPDPRGYAVYARAPQPMPAPVVLIETA